jgi:hypothetical protein
MARSRRSGLSRDQVRQQPLYARMLNLQHLFPSGFLCFVFLEGAVALGILLALAELVSWWGVLVLPLSVAVMVKLNDVIAGTMTRPVAEATRPTRSPTPPARPTLRPAVVQRPVAAQDDLSLARARTVDLQQHATQTLPAVEATDASALNGPPAARQWASPRAEQLGTRQQWARQSATHHYE